MNSTITTRGRNSIDGLYHALTRRLNENRSDKESAVLAEELLKEVRQLQENQDFHAHWTPKAGEKAIELLNDTFWDDPEEKGNKNRSFPKTRGVLFAAVLDGWEEAYNHYGAGLLRGIEDRFARFIARAINKWDEKERAIALLKLREKLKNTDPPVCLDIVCNFLYYSEQGDDSEVLHMMGRTFGHLASQEDLALAARAVRQAKDFSHERNS